MGHFTINHGNSELFHQGEEPPAGGPLRDKNSWQYEIGVEKETEPP
jgi:hypothetical protein